VDAAEGACLWPLAHVITNRNHEQQRAKIKKIGLDALLDCIFTSERTGYAKPAPEAFLNPCRNMKISPAQALYVGDNYSVDVEGAKNAGLQAIHLVRVGSQRDGTIPSLTGLRPILCGGTW
jgi:putative hydrolase of the HAD superfamily